MSKKILLSIGSIASAIAPIASVVACGSPQHEETTLKGSFNGTSFMPSGTTLVSDRVPTKYIDSVKDLYGYDLWRTTHLRLNGWGSLDTYMGDPENNYKLNNLYIPESSNIKVPKSTFPRNFKNINTDGIWDGDIYSQNKIRTYDQHLVKNASGIKYFVTRLGTNKRITGASGEVIQYGGRFSSDEDQFTIMKDTYIHKITMLTPNLYNSFKKYSFFNKRFFTEKLGAIGHLLIKNHLDKRSSVFVMPSNGMDPIYGSPEITNPNWRRQDEERYMNNLGVVIIPLSVLNNSLRTTQWRLMNSINREDN